MTPLVSIIIPAYNAEKFIAQTILSAKSQTHRHKEIIVVDDGSSDRTFAIANEFAGPEVRIFRQANKGASAARNKGFAESRGDYVQFLDADDLISSTKIEKQMIDAVVYGDRFIYGGKWKIFYQNPEEFVFSPNELWKDFMDPVDWLITSWTKQKWMHPSAWLTPRHLIEKAGPWDESLSLHDDGEFFCRILLQSKGVRFCREAESYYRKGIDNSLSSTFSEKAIGSHSRICQLYEKYLLQYTNSDKARKACATNYLAFYYTYYPEYKPLTRAAKEAAARLGLHRGAPQGTGLFYILKYILGWKLARRIEHAFHRKVHIRASIL